MLIHKNITTKHLTNKIMEEQGLGIALIICFIIVPILSEILSNLINNK